MSEEIKVMEELLKEAKKYIEEGNVVQASEKIYKVIEEGIKFLSSRDGVPEYSVAQKEGRWWTHLLGKAANTLSKKYNEDKIYYVWSVAYDLHVWGYHERKYDMETVKPKLKDAEWMLEFVKKVSNE